MKLFFNDTTKKALHAMGLELPIMIHKVRFQERHKVNFEKVYDVYNKVFVAV